MKRNLLAHLPLLALVGALGVGVGDGAHAAPSVDSNLGTWLDTYTDDAGVAPASSGLTAGARYDAPGRRMVLGVGALTGFYATAAIVPISASGWGRGYVAYQAPSGTAIAVWAVDAETSVVYGAGVGTLAALPAPLALAASDDPAYQARIDLSGVPATVKKLRLRVAFTGTVPSGATTIVSPSVSRLVVTWAPRAIVKLAASAPATAQAGETIAYRINAAVSFVDAKGLVVRAPLPTPTGNTADQDKSVTFDSATAGGTLSADGQSVEWKLGTRKAGETFVLTYQVRTRIGLLNTTTYEARATATTDNGPPDTSPAADKAPLRTIVYARPSLVVRRTFPSGIYRIENVDYAFEGSSVTVQVSGNNAFAGTGRETLFDAVAWDDVSSLVTPLAGGANPLVAPGITDISDQGVYTAAGVTLPNGIKVPAKSVYWMLGKLEPGQTFSRTYRIQLQKKKPDGPFSGGERFDGCSRLESGYASQAARDPAPATSCPAGAAGVLCANHCAGFTVGVPIVPGAVIALGEGIRDRKQVSVQEDLVNPQVSATFGERVSYFLYERNAGVSPIGDIVMITKVPAGTYFDSAFIDPATNATIAYYEDPDGFDAPADAPPSYNDATGELVGWTTEPPANPSDVSWVAFRVPYLTSFYFPEMDKPRFAEGELRVIIAPPAGACPAQPVSFKDTGIFRTFKYAPYPSTVLETIPGGTIRGKLDEFTLASASLPDLGGSDVYDTPSLAEAGNPLRYTIVVADRNPGGVSTPLDTALNPKLVIDIPHVTANGRDELLLVTAVDAGGGLVAYDFAAGTISITWAAPIKPNEQRVVTVDVKVPPGVIDGSVWTLSAKATANDDICGPVAVDLREQTSFRGLPALAVRKTANYNQGSVGTLVDYQLLWTNTGYSPSTATWILDEVPVGMTLDKVQVPTNGSVWFTNLAGGAQIPEALSPDAPFTPEMVAANFQRAVDTDHDGWVTSPFGAATTYVALSIDDQALNPPQVISAGVRSSHVVMRVASGEAGDTIVNRPAILSRELIQAIGNDVVFTVTTRPGLRVLKTCPEVVSSGGRYEYTITYDNDSANRADAVVLDEVIPDGVTYISVVNTYNAAWKAAHAQVTEPTVTVDPPHVGFNVGALGPLEGGTLVVTLNAYSTLTSGTFLTTGMTGVATTGPATREVFSECTTVVQNPDLLLQKLVSTSAPRTGQEVTYTVLVSNKGGNVAKGVSVTDDLPAGMTYVAGSTVVTPSTFALVPASEPQKTGQHLAWSVATGNALSLAKGTAGLLPAASATATISYRARVDGGVVPGTTLTNCADVATSSGEDKNFVNHGCVPVTTPLPDPWVTLDAPPVKRPGEPVTWRLTYGNQQNETAKGVVVIYDLPDGPMPAADGVVDTTWVSAGVSHGETIWYSHAAPGATPAFDPTHPHVGGWNTSPGATPVTHVAFSVGDLAPYEGPRTIDLYMTMTSPSGVPLAPGGTFSGTSVIRMTAAGFRDQDETNNNDDATTRTPGIDLALSAACDPDRAYPGVEPGELVHFAFTVENTGTVAAHGIKVTPTLPTGFELVGDGTGTAAVLDASGQAVNPIDLFSARMDHAVAWTRVGGTWYLGSSSGAAHRNIGLLPGDSSRVELTLRVGPSVASQTAATHTALVGTDYRSTWKAGDPVEEAGLLPNNQAECRVYVYRANPLVNKSVTDLTTGSHVIADGGDRLRYTLEYNNAGDHSADGVLLEDAIPAGTVFVAGSVANVDSDAVDLGYSNDGGQTFDYHPSVATGEPDPAVTHLRLTWKDRMPAPAGNTFAQTSAVDFARGTFRGTIADAEHDTVRTSSRPMACSGTDCNTKSYTSPIFPAASEGRALEWKRVIVNDEVQGEDQDLRYDVLDGLTGAPIGAAFTGVRPDGGVIDLSGVDASEHPRLQLRAVFTAPSGSCFVRIPKPDAESACEPEPMGISGAGVVFGNLWTTSNGKGGKNGASCPELPFRWVRGTNEDGTTSVLQALGLNRGKPGQAYGYAISDAGAIVGESITSQGGWHAVVWAPGATTPTDLHPADLKGWSWATSINEAGQIAGIVSGMRGSGPFLWTPNDGMLRPSPAPAAAWDWRANVNRTGLVAGRFRPASATAWHAYVWDAFAGSVVDLDVPTDVENITGMSDAGWIVGNGEGNRDGFLWRPGVGAQLLEVPGALQVIATGINKAGTVSGGFRDADGAWQPFVWSEDRGVQVIAVPGWANAEAVGITTDGTVLLARYDDTKATPQWAKTALWSPVGGVLEIEAPELAELWPHESAWEGFRSVNDRLQLTGQYFSWTVDDTHVDFCQPLIAQHDYIGAFIVPYTQSQIDAIDVRMAALQQEIADLQALPEPTEAEVLQLGEAQKELEQLTQQRADLVYRLDTWPLVAERIQGSIDTCLAAAGNPEPVVNHKFSAAIPYFVEPCQGGLTPALADWRVLYTTDRSPYIAFDTELADVCQSSVSNTATISTRSPQTTTDDDASSAVIAVNRADVSVSVTADKRAVQAGDTVTWTIDWKNAGPGTAHDVLVTGTLPTGVTPTGTRELAVIGTLAPGASGQAILRTRVTTTEPNLSLVGTFDVTTPTIDCSPSNDSASLSLLTGSWPNLWTTIGGPATVTVGEPLEVVLTYGNNGNDIAHESVLTYTPPAGFTVTGTTPEGDVVGGRIEWTLDDLAATETGTVSVFLDAPGCDALDAIAAHRVDIRTSSNESDLADNSASTETAFLAPAGRFELATTASRASVSDADTITYTAAYRNQGTGLVRNPELVATLPVGGTLVAGSVSAGGVATENGQVRWSASELPVGLAGAVTWTVRIPAGPVGTTSGLTGLVTASGDGACPVAQPLPAASHTPLGIHVAAAADRDTLCAADATGQTVTWSIVVSNTGASVAQNVVIHDVVPTGMRYVAGSIAGRGAVDVAAPQLRWDLGQLQPGEALTFTYRAIVTDPTTLTGLVVTDAPTVEIGEVGATTTPAPRAWVRLECAGAPHVTAAWTAGCAQPGEALGLTLTWKNDGAAVGNLTLTDRLPDAFVFVRSSAGQVVGGVLTVSLGNVARGASGVVTVTGTLAPSAAGGQLMTNLAWISANGAMPQTSNEIAGAALRCANDNDPCTQESCVPTEGCVHPAAPDGTSCSDNNLCTRVDTCMGGTCQGASPVVCAAADQCHTAGICQPATGACTQPNQGNGTACNDNVACTIVDACQNGTCVGAGVPELCNGRDDDCDGRTDEDFPTLGAICDGASDTDKCQNGTLICNEVRDGVICFEPNPGKVELCGGGDENCDGVTDEGFHVGEACELGIGECHATGTWACNTEDPTRRLCATAGAALPQAEVCDGKDNDCEGGIDNLAGTTTTICKPLDTDILTGPTSPTAATSGTFTYVNPLAVPVASHTTFECSLDGGAWVACDHGTVTVGQADSPLRTAPLPSGAHTLLVRATRGDGAFDTTPDFWAWTVDTTVPDTVILAAPTDPSQNGSGTFVFGALTPNPDHYSCVLDPVSPGNATCPATGDAAYHLCAEAYPFAGLADGPHLLCVYVTDTKGTPDPEPASHHWVIDTTAPETEIVAPIPPKVTGILTGPTTFYYVDPTAPDTNTFECALDGSAWSDCDGKTTTYNDLSEGEHTFAVRTVDPNGVVDPTPALYNWVVDLTAPCASIALHPTDPAQSPTAIFGLTATEDGVHFFCALDPAGAPVGAGADGPDLTAYRACDATTRLTDLADGAHTLWVYAVDTAQNLGTCRASYTWSIDTRYPETEITAGPTPLIGTGETATLTYVDPTDEDLLTFECKLDSAPNWTRCDGTVAGDGGTHAYPSLPIGKHSFAVRSCDFTKALALQCDPTPATWSWEVTTSPCPNDHAGPTLTCAAERAFECADGGATIALDALAPTTSDTCLPVDVSTTATESVGLGRTPLVFVAEDPNGNTSSCVAIVEVHDTTAPTITCPDDLLDATTDPGTCTAALDIVRAVADDACQGTAGLVHLSDAPTAFAPGETAVTHYAIDAFGNMASCVQRVVVRDEEPLTLTCSPSKTVDAPPDACQWAGTQAAKATDNCSQDLEVTVEGVYPIGDSPILFTAADEAGNSGECTTLLTVRDVTKPVVVCGTPVGSVPVVIRASASDACTATATIENVACTRLVGTTTTAVALADCPIAVHGDTIEITGRLAEGELGLTYDVRAVDPSGNVTVTSCDQSYAPDQDHDGIVDTLDNCVANPNSDQTDSDHDGVGDACDVCPDLANPDQTDSNGDGKGDACADTDEDGLLDVNDNCPLDANADQSDLDGDDLGDVCDPTPYEGLSASGTGGCASGGEGGALVGIGAALALIAWRRRRAS